MAREPLTAEQKVLAVAVRRAGPGLDVAIAIVDAAGHSRSFPILPSRV